VTTLTNEVAAALDRTRARSSVVVVDSLAKLVVAGTVPVALGPDPRGPVSPRSEWSLWWRGTPADRVFPGAMRPAGMGVRWEGTPERVLIRREPMTAAATRPALVVKRPNRAWRPPADPGEALLSAVSGGECLCLSDEALLEASYLAGLGAPFEQHRRLVDLACLLILFRVGVHAELWDLPNPPREPVIVYPPAADRAALQEADPVV
jgi:hypothetical protein